MIFVSLLLVLVQGSHPGEEATTAPRSEASAAFTVTNTGWAVTRTYAHERRLAVPRLEFEEGLDFNGDGDTQDQILHVYDLLTGTLTNLSLPVQAVPLFRGPFLAFAVPELPMQTDLNGDGDVNDKIVHVYDARDGSIGSTGVAARIPTSQVDHFLDVVAGALFFVADEKEESRDLNGDGDADDPLLRFAPLTPRPSSSRSAAGLSLPVALHGLEALDYLASFHAAGRTVLAHYDERSSGRQDFNGDGDHQDRVIQGVGGATLQRTNYGRAGSVLRAFGARAAVSVSERQEGADLNGDGDTLDDVLHVLDVDAGDYVTTGLVSGTDTYVLGDTLWFLPSESSAAQDFNGDGDMADGVVHLLGLLTGTPTNVMLAARGPVGGSGSRFLCTVYERDQDRTDLNGDGDIDDEVLHAIDTSGSVLNLVTAGRVFESTERLVVFWVDEQDQGADFNFDGDPYDRVLGVYDSQLDVFRNLAVSVAGSVVAGLPEAADGPRVLFRVSEREEGGRDLNGDGDAFDGVLHVYDADTNTVVNLGLGTEGLFHAADLAGNIVTVPVHEASQGGTDLNGDGDTADSILHLVELP